MTQEWLNCVWSNRMKLNEIIQIKNNLLKLNDTFCHIKYNTIKVFHHCYGCHLVNTSYKTDLLYWQDREYMKHIPLVSIVILLRKPKDWNVNRKEALFFYWHLDIFSYFSKCRHSTDFITIVHLKLFKFSHYLL